MKKATIKPLKKAAIKDLKKSKEQDLKKSDSQMSNNKSRASGSGTTSQARRERRQGVQWTSLSHADPPCTSSESLEEKLEALKKAQASAEEQLKKKKKEEEEEKAALKKAEEDLDKALAKRGKNGPRSRSQSRARLSTAEEAAKEHALKDRLTKQLAQLKLDTDPSLKKDNSLKKEKGAASSSKGTTTLKKGKKSFKKVVVVDWHNTLEKGNAVPEKNLKALETLMLLAEVHIISWVGSQARYEATLEQIEDLLPAETLKKVSSYQCIWQMLGQDGKIDWACWLEAEAIFDDQPDVIKEGAQWGVKGYPIRAWGKDHTGEAFWSFADAVDQFVLDQAKKP